MLALDLGLVDKLVLEQVGVLVFAWVLGLGQGEGLVMVLVLVQVQGLSDISGVPFSQGYLSERRQYLQL